MTAARLGTAAGIWGAASAAGAGDWIAFAAIAIPAIGFLLYAVTTPAPSRSGARR